MAADPYRLTGPRTPSGDGPRSGVSRADVARFLLWLLLVLGLVANTVASYVGAGLGVHLVCGAVSAVTAAVLVVHRLKGRR
ncbi:hypothetical protein [Streptomyces sp. NPDC047000]|uniref:hypothetical protein n=1 Tax=Streptomyces sp. NPDC047000 TaxID=3155474 RepID=UPI0033EA7BA4